MTWNGREHLRPLFEQAVSLPEPERAAFVKKLRAGDGELGRQLAELLASYAETVAFTPQLRAGGGPIEQERRLFATNELLLTRFRIGRFLGHGGMGEVYQAEDMQLGPVALKTIRPEMARPESLARFTKEVRLARRVTNPHVCRIYDLFTAPSNERRPAVTFFTMELLPGATLADRLKAPAPVPLDEARQIALDLCEALQAIHEAGVIHRDLKSRNIMLVPRGNGETQAVVMDLGLACEATPGEGDTTITLPGEVMGTPEYMAPEQFRAGELSISTDIYALGVVLYEMITGERPFRASSPLEAAVMRAKRLPKPSSIRSEAGPEWDEVVSRCLEFEANARFASAADVAATLTTIRPEIALHPAEPATRPLRTERITRRVLVGAGAAGIAAAAAAGWMRWPEIDAAMHPLPGKRYVALMLWPDDAGESVRPLVNAVLDAIARRLVRAESAVHDLLIMRPGDVSGPVTHPREAVHVLGANLVLAASARRVKETLTLSLRILDAAAAKVLRERRISAPAKGAGTLPQKAALAALALLQLPDSSAGRQTDDPAAHVTPQASEAYAAAEDLVRQPNDTKLNDAIAKYQQALEADGSFALAYARLAMAYLRVYQLRRDAAALRLAERNSNRAIELAPGLAQSILSDALTELYNGRTAEAMEKLARARSADPGDTEILMYQAVAFRNLDRAPDEEAVYRLILKQRPNFWPAYNSLGRFLYRHGRLKEALQAFEEASAAAPSAALPLTNAGVMLVMLNRRSEAIEAFQKSLRAAPNELALINLGNIAFGDRAYDRALDFYQKAREVNPKSHQIFRDIGDCYEMTGNPARVVENYAKASDLLQDELRLNPRTGGDWMRLAFYDAKSKRLDRVRADISTAEERGASDVTSQFMKAQVLAATGEKEAAVQLVLTCLNRGMSSVEVDFAPDLKGVRADPRYRKWIAAHAAAKSGTPG